MIIMVSISLLWGELYTGILVPQNVDSKMNIYTADSVIGYTYTPKASTYEKGREYNALYEINSLGLRDREYGSKKQGVFRVLLLGDSFSVSHGLSIEDSLSRQMERELQKVADHDGMAVKFEVINAAAGGYSPYNYWKAYIRWASFFHPDAVIIGLSPDDYDSSNAGFIYLIEGGETLATYRNGETPQKSGGSLIRRLRKWLSWNSEFYILLRNFLYYNEIAGQISTWFAAKGKARINQLQQFITPQPESITLSWKSSFSYLDELHKATANDNVSLLMISIPLKDEIDYTQFHRTLAASGLSQSQTDINQPLSEISNYCKARKIPLFDPRPAIKARHLETPCYFVYDGHWIAEGIRVATDAVAKQWRDMHLPPWNQNVMLESNNKLN
jgi:hypothetical protein